MSFQSLYRKHRPQRFSELLGQEHVTQAVRNAVRDERVGHAYLFSGPRGTGKTTTARLLAKALNCTDLADDGEPCGVCESCVEIAKGSSMDVIELDAASNNGVAEMRSLLERVAFRSAGGRHRVYIVDEVHMLSKGASNALLKTLEEPPDHVVFVLATTDPQAVLPTIRSRTQHFEFSLLPTGDLAAYLRQVLTHEKIEADDDALSLVARRGGGSVRDALSLLDQALALGEGHIHVDRVRGLVEGTPFDRRAALVDSVASEDPAGALGALHELLEGGADPRHVADDLLRHLRDVYLVTASQGQAQVDALAEERELLEEQGRVLGAARVERALDTLGEAAVDMRRAPDPRIVLEVALVRLARRQAGTRVEVLLDRVERLERTLQGENPGSVTPSVSPSPAANIEDRAEPAEAPAAPTGAAGEARRALGAVRSKSPSPPATEQAPAAGDTPAASERQTDESSGPAAASPPAAPAAASPPAAPAAADEALDMDDVVVAWPQALEGMRAVLKAVAREAQPMSVDGTTVVLGLPQALEHQRGRLERDLDKVSELLAGALDRPRVGLRVEVVEGFLDDDGSGSRKDSGGVSGSLEEEPGEEPEIDPTREVEDAAVDSVERLRSAFDATVEDDT